MTKKIGRNVCEEVMAEKGEIWNDVGRDVGREVGDEVGREVSNKVGHEGLLAVWREVNNKLKLLTGRRL